MTGCVSADESAVTTENKVNGSQLTEAEGRRSGNAKWYQVSNITIPEGDNLRSRKDLNNPPRLFFKIYENGKHIKTGTEKYGWIADFPREGNIFGVWIDSDVTYSIEVWDDQWTNELIFTVTGISGEAFGNRIYRDGGQYDTKDNLASLAFKEVADPESD